MTKDYYKILGISEFDSNENIKTAYRKLVRQFHPDIAGNSQENILRFKEITEAYEVLSNQVKKTEYDKAKRFYDYASKSESKKETINNSTNPQNKNKNFSFNWEDFLSKKNKNATETKSPKRGKDIFSDIEISIFEAIGGTTKIINMLQTNVCQKCKGRKFINGSVCNECNGKGEKSSYKKFTVKIPANIKNGSKIRLAGEGCCGENGGMNGDLYITVHIQEPNNYKTEGLNILKTISITPFEAVLGTTVKINSINGFVNVKIAPMTQNGQKIRLTGCGLVQNNKFGDMIITVEIKIPQNLSVEEINLYRKLKEISINSIRNSEEI